MNLRFMFTLDLASQMVSMSLEKIFQPEVLLFSLCSCRCLLLGLFSEFCFLSLYGALQHCLWCVSAWFVVRFEKDTQVSLYLVKFASLAVLNLAFFILIDGDDSVQ